VRVAASLASLLTGCVCLYLLPVAVRLQIQDKANPQYRGLLHVMTSMLRDEGLTVPWRGVSAGIQRQMAFAPIRIGLYEPVRNRIVPREQTGPATILQKIAAGLTTSSAQQQGDSTARAQRELGA
jgi:solute carrier family 25 uncoupling protein 8/9